MEFRTNFIYLSKNGTNLYFNFNPNHLIYSAMHIFKENCEDNQIQYYEERNANVKQNIAYSQNLKVVIRDETEI